MLDIRELEVMVNLHAFEQDHRPNRSIDGLEMMGMRWQKHRQRWLSRLQRSIGIETPRLESTQGLSKHSGFAQNPK